MLDLSGLVPFHSGQVKKNLTQFRTSNWIILNLHVVWKTVWILISWLLQKPADLDLHCFQLGLYLFSYCFQKKFTFGISTVSAKHKVLVHYLPSRTSIIFFKQVQYAI